jgi:hypothetical protein
VTFETDIFPAPRLTVTGFTFTLFKRLMLHRPQQPRSLTTMRIMTTQAGHLLRIPVKMGFIKSSSGFMTGETKFSLRLPQKP